MTAKTTMHTLATPILISSQQSHDIYLKLELIEIT